MKRESDREHLSSPETSREREVEFKKRMIISTDREGWIGVSELLIDPRAKGVRLEYMLNITHLKGASDVSDIKAFYSRIRESDYKSEYTDDHYRAIHEELGNPGLNQSRFDAQRSEEMESERNVLLARSKELSGRINQLNGELFNPAEVKIRVVRGKCHDFSGEIGGSSDGRSRGDSSSTVDYYVYWSAYESSEKYRSKHEDILGFKFVRSGDLSEEGEEALVKEAKTKLTDEYVQEIEDKLSEFKDEYVRQAEGTGFNEMNREKREIDGELEYFDKVQVLNVFINTFEKGVDGYDQLLELLDGEDSMTVAEDFSLEVFQQVEKDTKKKREEFEIRERIEKEENRIRNEKWQKEKAEMKKQKELKEAIAVEEDKAREIEAEKDQIRIEAELTPEVCEKIENGFLELKAFEVIVKKISSKKSEIEKIKTKLPAISQIEKAYSDRLKGEEILDDIQDAFDKTVQLLSRKKVNSAYPKLKEHCIKVFENWQSIQDKINESEEAEMIFDDELISKDDLITQVSSEFLKDPWNLNVDNLIETISNEILDSIDS